MSHDINHFQEGDIYRWSWNDEMLKKLDLERKLKQIAWEIELAEKDISQLTTDSYIYCGDDVSLNDVSYQDAPL